MIAFMSTSAEGYTIRDLARLAAVTPRTIRYYVAQGLLPPPVTHGPATRYEESHLARLRLVRRLQRRHLPLAEIRRQVEALGDADIQAALAEPEPAAGNGGSALDYIRGVLAEPRRRPVDRLRPPPNYRVHALARLSAAEPFSPPAAAAPMAAAMVPPSGFATTPAAPQRSQWDRITLAPDIELHVRRPLSRLANRQVDRVIAAARDVIQETQP
jgi:DNA-binding transcriptional MerR regulator